MITRSIIKILFIVAVCSTASVVVTPPLAADDKTLGKQGEAASKTVGDSKSEAWSTYRHDNRRSGVTAVGLSFPLEKKWEYRSPQPPQMAWTGPAKWDAYSGNSGLQSMRNFDPCFYVTADDVNVYFGSSADDAAHAIDQETGEKRWSYVTGAAVRFPPTIVRGLVYFGSDDGCVYCCDAMTGELKWRQSANEPDKRIASNRKLISLWPVRTGVLADETHAIFAGSLVPWEKSYLWSVDLETGEADGDRCFRRELSGVTLQGALLASSQRLYAPQGRAAPLTFDRSSGEPRGKVGEAGGVFCVLSEDEMLFAGPPHQKEKDDQIRVADMASRGSVASFSGTDRILVDDDVAWLAVGGKLKRLNRQQYVQAQRLRARSQKDMKEGLISPTIGQAVTTKSEERMRDAWGWEVDSAAPLDLIKAGNCVVVGMDRGVAAYDSDSGRELWREEVVGAVHGLAVANGILFVSTDLGHIHAFGASR
ncbi:MAG: PQQ-binding-like beta-propeller repeat protein [Rubripirellula sp.]